MRTAEIFAVLAICGSAYTSFAAATGCAEFRVERPKGGVTPVIRAADYGLSETNRCNISAINRAVETCRRIGAKTLELAPGTYRCASGANGIAITNMQDFTFDGRGATLVFASSGERQKMSGKDDVEIADCERVLVCDLRVHRNDTGGKPRDGLMNGGCVVKMASNRHLTMQDVEICADCGVCLEIEGIQDHWKLENVKIALGADAPCGEPAARTSIAYRVAGSCGFAMHRNVSIVGSSLLDIDNMIVRNCRFERSGAVHGISGSNVTVEDCVFRDAGIAVASVCGGEDGAANRCTADNVAIRNNRFESTSKTAAFERDALITVGSMDGAARGEVADLDGVFARDVTVEGNVIVDPVCRSFVAEFGSGMEFFGNEIRFTSVPRLQSSGAVVNGAGVDVAVERNFCHTNPAPCAVSYTAFPEAERVELVTCPVVGGRRYVAEGGYVAERFVPGALIALSAIELDGSGKVVERHDQGASQIVTASGFRHKIAIPFTAHTNAAAVKVEISVAGNPVTFTPLQAYVRAASQAPLYGGIYDKEDPPPQDRAAALAEMAKIAPSTAKVVRRKGRNTLVIDGKEAPLNQYKGFTDYRLMGECGGNVVITFNRGTRLFLDSTFDEAVRDEKSGEFDFSRVEDTLLRIHAANPEARVFVNVDLDPDKDFLERNQDSIFVNEKGERGRSAFGAFRGYDSSPLDPDDKLVNWAYSYTSQSWQEYVKDGLRRLCEYLKSTPAGNIVAGFHLAGGMDGQFVQWEYGPQNGHFDYSEANRKALCAYLREIYGTETALREAWGDSRVTFETAGNPTVAEFKSRQAFDDRPGFGRRLADCRRFVSVGPARALNGFAQTLKSAFGRPCVVETWYTSTLWSQAGRLAIDELVKGNGVDVICTVSGYGYLRNVDGPGCSADNSIAGLNLRGLVYAQEMDHRTWRTQRTGVWMETATAIPSDEREFANQVRRDAGSVIAAGGAGFHMFDMFGSWYHGSRVMPVLKEVFAMNRFATDHAGEYPLPRVAIFTDEKARLLRENTYDCVNVLWRTSGVAPAMHYLADIENPDLPQYGLAVVWSPVTITKGQVAAFRKRILSAGGMLAVIGEAGCGSRDFSDTADVLDAFGMKASHSFRATGETVVRKPKVRDPLLEGWYGTSDAYGMTIRDGRLVRRHQVGITEVTDRNAKVLGVWEKGGGAAFARKRVGCGTLVYMSREGGLSPQLLNRLAVDSGIAPFAKPGNATYVGNGIAVVHRLADEAEVDFGQTVELIDPVTGAARGAARRWRPALAVGESAAVAYRMRGAK